MVREKDEQISKRFILFDENKHFEHNNIMQYIYINNYLENVIKNIEKTSISPKIAGVTLDQAFGRLAISSFIACITFLITYYVKYKI